MGYVLTFDFETRDTSIARGRGAGWAYQDFDILGMAYQIADGPTQWTSNPLEMKELVNGSRTLVAHNAQYDLGCLSRLGILYDDKLCIDTLILAKLYDNTGFSYGLDKLSADMLGDRKDYGSLELAASELGIRNPMANIAELYIHRPDLVIKYAKQDVNLTYRLSQWYKAEHEAYWLLLAA